jgi:uncharacterized protein
MSELTDRIEAGDLEGVVELLERDPDALARESAGPSPILSAVYAGHEEIARRLRERKGSLDIFEAAAMGDLHELDRVLRESEKAHDAFAPDGFTPLGLAAYFGHSEAVARLLAAGADPNVASQNDVSAAPLHSALARGHKEIARQLVQAGADVDAPGPEGSVPLHYVADRGDVETAKFLLDRNAKRDVARSDGKLPAEVAEEKGFLELGELLRPVGA